MTVPISKLDTSQVLPLVLDEENRRLMVDAAITTTLPGDVEVMISADDDSIRIGGSGGSSDLITSHTEGGSTGLDVHVLNGITGEVSISGLRVGGRNTTTLMTDTAAPIPAIPFSGRNSLTVTNLDPVETVYIGFDLSVTADSVIGTTSGFRLQPGESFSIDITDEVQIYGICETGVSAKVIITEVA